MPNSVDVDRFHPVGQTEKRRLRVGLGFPESALVVLVVAWIALSTAVDVARQRREPEDEEVLA